MTVKVYGVAGCVACDATCRSFDKKGVHYDYVDLGLDSVAAEYVASLGYKEAPVVIAGDDHWSGFRPDRINALATQLQAA